MIAQPNDNRNAVHLDAQTQRRVQELARSEGVAAEEIIRAAVEHYAAESGGSIPWLERASAFGLIGCVEGGPADLSTNRTYLEGLGRDATNAG